MGRPLTQPKKIHTNTNTDTNSHANTNTNININIYSIETLN